MFLHYKLVTLGQRMGVTRVTVETIIAGSCEQRSEEGALRLLKNIAAAANSADNIESAFGVACEEILAFTG